MAKIEMDLSEYEKMQENKRLLETSLEDQKKLQAQVNELNEEKVKLLEEGKETIKKALEDAKMKVVKITRKVTTQHTLIKVPSNDSNILRVVQLLARAHDQRYGDSPSSDPQRYHMSRTRPYMSNPIHELMQVIDMDEFRACFFESTTGEGPSFEEITTHGLDEVKKELRADILADMSTTDKEKLEAASEALVKFDDLLNQVSDANKKVKKATISNTKLLKTIDKMQTTVEEQTATIEDHEAVQNADAKKLTAVKHLLVDGYGFTGKGALLNKIIQAVK